MPGVRLCGCPRSADIVRRVKNIPQDIICFVDNCYGGFVEDYEPLEAGQTSCWIPHQESWGVTLDPSGGSHRWPG